MSPFLLVLLNVVLAFFRTANQVTGVVVDPAALRDVLRKAADFAANIVKLTPSTTDDALVALMQNVLASDTIWENLLRLAGLRGSGASMGSFEASEANALEQAICEQLSAPAAIDWAKILQLVQVIIAIINSFKPQPTPTPTPTPTPGPAIE